MPINARYRVGFARLIGPLKQTLEALVLEGSGWRPVGHRRGGAMVAVSPFDALQLALQVLWA